MNIEILKHKNLRGRITGYSAKLGALETSIQPTASAAKLRLETELIDALKRLDRGEHIFTQHGVTVVISPTLTGFRYAIVNDPKTGSMNGVHTQNSNRDEVESAARVQAAYTAWSADCSDDYWFIDRVNIPRISDQERENILSWIVFQRHHLEFKRQGVDHQCWHGCETVNDHSLLKGKRAEVTA